ncbi:Coenzyme F420 hydrogenase/dehydrogenase, beta subunit C-terminal domain [Cellulomonas dongxiuzhuiae]|uniref:Coenzyme F420 hydrogenase/dehydrogenase, beta subunit C-terminal domain n=1 Tax=Cellulomonas dongxiuzhuiae TaxID=2819979 RepID=UPI001AAF5A81|nr:Coenzyme F420 hydrogenase/dehydrogenase, beta subunit C-terminal domain [Cellulomonas dongxiuzhuiae]MBO3088801.1 Coenzyme F420 hydrogenase/dehydrogenase, beta subunit C-terminal domain [Cellulomonas dongxiuzhuiae]
MDEGNRRIASRVCPFSDEAPTEDDLGTPTAQGNELPWDKRLGYHSQVLAGRHVSDDYLMGSSSGGLTSWVLEQLLARGAVDGVIHVGRTDGPGTLFNYQESDGPAEARHHRKSQYYATTMEDVLARARKSNRRYALVGVPCFIKAARALCREDSVLNDRLVVFVGLVCGHLKSHFFAESLAWQLDVHPGKLESVDFRMKHAGRPAGDYDFGARADQAVDVVRGRTRELVGGNWGHGAFQPEACNFCDDVFAETADVAFGDAWLPEYSSDWRGTNVVVTRSELIDDILRAGNDSGEILTEAIATGRAAESQAGNFRHRRDGLAVRLADDKRSGLSVPIKRVEPRWNHVSARRRRLIRQRRLMSRRSFDLYVAARERSDLNVYLHGMQSMIRRYRRIESPGWRRFGGRVKRLFKGIVSSRQGRRT